MSSGLSERGRDQPDAVVRSGTRVPRRPVRRSPRCKNLHYPCVENFVSAVLDGAPLVSSGKTAIVTDWVTEQAIASNRG